MSSGKVNLSPITSIRTRLTAIFVGIFGVTLIAFSIFLYQVFVRNHESEFDNTLFNYAVDVAHTIDVNLFGEITLTPNVLSDSEKVFPFALGQTFIQVRTIRGQSIARSKSLGSADLPINQDERGELLRGHAVFRSLTARDLHLSSRYGGAYRMVSYFIDKPGPFDFVLQVAVPTFLLDKEEHGLITFFSSAIPLVLVIAALGGLFLSKKALAPVNAIITKVNDITAHQLSERVPVPEARDEIRELAQTLNGLLDRLEQAFRSQETFVADASHQLKTPLAILRGEIDLMRAKPRSTEEIHEFLASASQEVSYLSRMVEDLLLLARMDAGAGALAIRPVRLDETVMEAVARLERVAKNKGVDLAVNLLPGSEELGDEPFQVRGDPDLLRGLVENLIENAIKYSPEHRPVTVEVRDASEKVVFAIADQGSGISSDAIPRIFNRFYRSESTRDKISGSGLGLAIAKRIVEVHGGKIVVRSAPGKGTSFDIQIPKLASAPV